MPYFVATPVLISRWAHQISVAIITGGCILAGLGYANFDAKNHLPITIAGVIALLSGFFNLHVANPSELGERSKFYRFLIYGIKLPLWFALTPLLNKFVTDTVSIRAVAVVLLVMVSSLAKFYREYHKAAAAKNN